jgi:uncharacterized RDD family membrane protein YckC
MASETPPLDTRVEIITPENIAFGYRVAGPFRRLPAYLMDVFIRVAAIMLLGLAVLVTFGPIGLGGVGMGLMALVWFALDWFYGGLFEALWNGQTPGKRLMGIRVITVEGQPISGWQAILRNFLRMADAMPPIPVPSYLLGLVSTSMNNRFQRLGDLASGTMVIVEQPQRHYGVAQVTEPEAIRLAGYLPTNLRVSRSMGRALAAYVQRRLTFPWARRAEIAMHLGEPLRVRFGLPRGTSHDLLLCAMYYRAFIADRPQEGTAADQPLVAATYVAPVAARAG